MPLGMNSWYTYIFCLYGVTHVTNAFDIHEDYEPLDSKPVKSGQP